MAKLSQLQAYLYIYYRGWWISAAYPRSLHPGPFPWPRRRLPANVLLMLTRWLQVSNAGINGLGVAGLTGTAFGVANGDQIEECETHPYVIWLPFTSVYSCFLQLCQALHGIDMHVQLQV